MDSNFDDMTRRHELLLSVTQSERTNNTHFYDFVFRLSVFGRQKPLVNRQRRETVRRWTICWVPYNRQRPFNASFRGKLNENPASESSKAFHLLCTNRNGFQLFIYKTQCAAMHSLDGGWRMCVPEQMRCLEANDRTGKNARLHQRDKHAKEFSHFVVSTRKHEFIFYFCKILKFVCDNPRRYPRHIRYAYWACLFDCQTFTLRNAVALQMKLFDKCQGRSTEFP